MEQSIIDSVSLKKKKKNICKALRKFYTKQMAIANGLYTTLVVNSVINAILSFTAIVLNIITIQALRKTSLLSKTLKTLLLSLAISDVGVGLVAQPLFVAKLAMKIEQNTNSIAYPAIIVVVCIITTGLRYCKIYAAVRPHKSDSRSASKTSSTEWRNAKCSETEKNGSCYIFRVCGVLVCYLPVACIVFAKTNGGTVLLSRLEYFTLTLAYLNSSLIPLIYCWKMRDIRQTVMVILRNIFPRG